MAPAAEHQQLLTEALEIEGEGHRLLLAGDREAASGSLSEAAERYRRSWEASPPSAFGRLVGMLKAAVLAAQAAEAAEAASFDASQAAAHSEAADAASFDASQAAAPSQAAGAAAYVRGQLGDAADSPTSAYALAVAALVQGDDVTALRAVETMRAGDSAFARAADALAALATRDAERYDAALRAIVADFEGRSAHVTGVAIADTALMLETLAAERGLAVRPRSPVLP